MKKALLLIICNCMFVLVYAKFDDYFVDKTLRLDYYHTGNNKDELFSFDQLIEEPYWGGSHINLIDTFNFGSYKLIVYDSVSNKIIYTRGYCTLFNEWKATDEAKTLTKSFSETVVFPYPKKTVKIEIYSRDKKNDLTKMFQLYINPYNYFISHEKYDQCDYFRVHFSGESYEKLDIVIIPDGYTKEEMEIFKKDCDIFAGYLFNASPFKENKNNINIWAVIAPSEDSGPDFPGLDIWKRTTVNSSFYTFNTERYLMTTENKKIRNLASNTPYDQIYILVNSDHYGGGGIYNFYSTCTSGHKNSNFVFIHEFGHAFAGLGDEYYTSEVSVEDFYPTNVEPWEPNLTTLVSFDKKWKKMIDKNLSIPTPVIPENENKVGVYEGGGYMAKGVYRPMIDCTMKSVKYNYFCPVCRKAIQNMIDFYTK